jgi:hypothetical protein
MLSDLDFLNSIPVPSAPPAASITEAEPTALPFLPLDHPLHAELAPLIQSLTLAQSGDDLDDDSVEALMKQLDEAEGAADGIEDKLDSLLESLDDMLSSIGGSKIEEKVDDQETEKVIEEKSTDHNEKSSPDKVKDSCKMTEPLL